MILVIKRPDTKQSGSAVLAIDHVNSFLQSAAAAELSQQRQSFRRRRIHKQMRRVPCKNARAQSSDEMPKQLAHDQADPGYAATRE